MYRITAQCGVRGAATLSPDGELSYGTTSSLFMLGVTTRVGVNITAGLSPGVNLKSLTER